jgi:uncharacterized membrane protein
MTSNHVDVRTGVVRPITCYKAGWAIIGDQYGLILGVSLVGILIGSTVPFGILMGAMMCGIYKCLLARYRGERASFDMLFKGFDHFSQSLIACLIMIAPVFLIVFPLDLLLCVRMFKLINGASAQAPNPAQFLHGFLPFFILMIGAVTIVSIIIGLLFMFAFPLIVDRGLSAIEALKTSARAVRGNLGGLIGLLLLNMLLSFAGMLCCCIGSVLVMPLGFAAVLIAYQQVFGSETPTAVTPQ